MSIALAPYLLNAVLDGMPRDFERHKSMRILVVCAGAFPSFLSLIDRLTQKIPTLEHIDFSLIEPLNYKTDAFLKRAAPFLSGLRKPGPLITVRVAPLPLHEWIEKSPDRPFHIIYFEHADFRVFPILLARALGVFKHTVSLRASLPRLSVLMVPKTFIMASCLSYCESQHLRYLLHFSFGVRPQLIRLGKRRDYFYGGRFCSGLSMTVSLPLCQETQKKREQFIKRSDDDLCRVIALSWVLFVIKCSAPHTMMEVIIASSIVVLLLFFHPVGENNDVMKLFLLIGLTVI